MKIFKTENLSTCAIFENVIYFGLIQAYYLSENIFQRKGEEMAI